MDLVVLLKSNTPFGILIHTSKGKKSILLAKPLTLTVIAGRKLMGKIITVKKSTDPLHKFTKLSHFKNQ